MKRLVLASTILPTVLLFAGFTETKPKSTAEAASESANWLMYGRTYDDHRFSPLNQINEQSVANLGLVGAWNSAPRAVSKRLRSWKTA